MKKHLYTLFTVLFTCLFFTNAIARDRIISNEAIIFEDTLGGSTKIEQVLKILTYTLLSNDGSDSVSWVDSLGAKLFRIHSDGRLSGKYIDTSPNSQSTKFGKNSAFSNTTGISWTAIGEGAGYTNTIGGSWTAIGYSAGFFNLDGGEWTAIGANAGFSNTAGNQWTAIGRNAAKWNTTGDAWTAIGAYSGYTNTTGDAWTAVGISAGRNNVDGISWTAVGNSAGYSNINGDYWTAVGYNAAALNTAGVSWTAVGKSSGQNSTTGGFWTALGENAGVSNTTGNSWTAVGQSTGYANIDSDNWTALGQTSALNVTTGDNWTAIGQDSGSSTNAGANLTTINDSVFIGHDARALAASSTNEIVIGTDAHGNGDNTATIGNASITDTYIAGNLRNKGFTYPATDGTAGQVVQTNASGVFSVGDITASIVSDFDTEVSNNSDVASNTSHRTSTGADHTYIDQSVVSGSTPTFTGTNITGVDHGSNGGLLDDDHTQYGLLAGRAGGQTLIGSTLTGENLTLYSNALNDGKIYIGNNSVYDENTGRLGIANLSPDYGLSVGDGNTSNWISIARGGSSESGLQFERAGNVDNKFYTSTIEEVVFENLFLNRGFNFIPYTNSGVGINKSLPSASLHIVGWNSTSAGYACKIENSSNTNIISCRNDGLVTIPDEAQIGKINATGSVREKITTVSTATHTLAGDEHTIAITYATGATLTLPSASTVWDATNGTGIVYEIMDSGNGAGANPHTIQRAGADTIIDSSGLGNTSTQITSNGGAITVALINSTTWQVR